MSSFSGILGGDAVTETSLESENLTAHKWDIVNKYYNTSIHLCKMTDRILLSESTAERIDALVIYFDSTAVIKERLEVVLQDLKLAKLLFYCRKRLV